MRLLIQCGLKVKCTVSNTTQNAPKCTISTRKLNRRCIPHPTFLVDEVDSSASGVLDCNALYKSLTYLLTYFAYCPSHFLVAAWRTYSGNIVGRINEVTLRRVRLVLGSVTFFGGQTTSVFYQATQANSASYPQRDGKSLPAKVR